MNEDKEKMLKLTTDQIESKFGKGSIMTLGEGGADLNIGVIPTGALPLDAALGIDEGDDAAQRLGLRENLQGERCLAA